MEKYDPHPSRNVVPLRNVNKIDGIKLEDIPEISPGYSPGYAIIVRDFDTFLMKKREGLSHEAIYEMARILAKEKNIELPK